MEPVNAASPLQQVMQVMETPEDLPTRVGTLSQVLKKHPDWENNSDVFDYLVTKTGNDQNQEVVKFREELIDRVERFREKWVRDSSPLGQVRAVMDREEPLDLAERVDQVSKVLQNHPEWEYKHEVREYLLAKTANTNHSKVEQFRKALLPNRNVEGLNLKTGVFSITEEKLQSYPLEFWKEMSKPEVKSLVIHKSPSGSVVYEPAFLKQVLERKPDVKDLTKEIKLAFYDGELTVPLAKLRICGDFFEHIDSGMKEMTEESSLPLDQVSQDGFQGILNAIETEEFDFRFYPRKFHEAVDFVQFRPTILPECILSSKECWGDEVDELPTRELLHFLNEVNPRTGEKWKDHNQVTVWWKPSTDSKNPLTVRNAETHIKPPKMEGIKIEVDRKRSHFPAEFKEQSYDGRCLIVEFKEESYEGGCWMVMIHKPQQSKVAMDYKDAEKLISDLNKELRLKPEEGFELPSGLDATLGCMLHLSCSGERKERILPQEDHVRYTWCKGGYLSWHMLVGAVSPSGGVSAFYVHDGANSICGVCPVRKFYGRRP